MRLRHATRRKIRYLVLPSILLNSLLNTNTSSADEIDKLKVNQYKIYAHLRIIDDPNYRCVVDLWELESKWNPKAKNKKSSAYGIPQILGLKETNPFKQIDHGLRYLDARYSGDGCKALAYHKKHGWY